MGQEHNFEHAQFHSRDYKGDKLRMLCSVFDKSFYSRLLDRMRSNDLLYRLVLLSFLRGILTATKLNSSEEKTSKKKEVFPSLNTLTSSLGA